MLDMTDTMHSTHILFASVCCNSCLWRVSPNRLKFIKALSSELLCSLKSRIVHCLFLCPQDLMLYLAQGKLSIKVCWMTYVLKHRMNTWVNDWLKGHTNPLLLKYEPRLLVWVEGKRMGTWQVQNIEISRSMQRPKHSQNECQPPLSQWTRATLFGLSNFPMRRVQKSTNF